MQLNDKTNPSNDYGKSEKVNQEDEPSSLPKIETFLSTMKVYGKAMIVLIDTGVYECLIRQDFVTDMSLIKPSPNSAVKLLDGSEVNILGYVDMAYTDREGKVVEIPFYVVAELSYPLILGANWIQTSSAILNNEIKVEVGDIGPIVTLVDSGCTMCVIRRDVLKYLSTFKIEPVTGDTTIRLFDGSKNKILGSINLRVSYLGKTVELPFYVVEEASNLLVLGTNWIRKSGAILQSDGKQKLGVTFGGKKEKVGVNKWYCFRPFVSVKVDGIGKVSALVDTGATNCSIRRDTLTELQNLKATPISSVSTMGNGTAIKSLGLISLNITLQGKTTCIENVRIMSHMNDKLNLGMDWIHKTRAVIQSDGSKVIASLPKQKKSNRVIAYLSKQWNSTIGSVSRISSLVSNLM